MDATPPDAPEPDGRAELRRAAFLEAARDVFLEYGYEAASMAEIVRRAGGSLSTLYAQFGDKEGLFLAMVDARVAEITEQLEIELAAHAPLREGLQRIGERVLALTLAPRSVAMMRLMASQARKFPDLVRRYYKAGPDRVRQALAVYLADRAAAGEIALADPEEAAGLFFDLLRGRPHFRALFDDEFAPDEAMRRALTERAVRVFMAAAPVL
jgi:AcrR family transcriptional regulator